MENSNVIPGAAAIQPTADSISQLLDNCSVEVLQAVLTILRSWATAEANTVSNR
jgi:hypothetical protein